VIYKYLLVGGGPTCDSAIQSIRKVDPYGTIGVISSDEHQPYDRSPLSKGLWKGGNIDDIWRNTGNLGANLHLSRTATALKPDQKIVYDHEGQQYKYEKLLIATGGTPRHLEIDVKDVIYFRTVDDYFRLKALVEQYENFGVIGGSFIASEIASALAMKGKHVTMIFPEKGILASIMPETVTRYLNEYYKGKNVEIFKEEAVTKADKIGREIMLDTNRGTMLAFDGVVAGIGIVPETSLAKSAGLRVSNGIVVDKFLRTSNPDIYAAGDVACFTYPFLGSPMRFEHEDAANAMGRIAGLNMAGKQEAYYRLPSYSSDLFNDIHYDVVGDVNSRLDYVVDWKEEFKIGVIYYLTNGHLRGVLLWNIPGRIDAARELIASSKIYNSHTLKGLLLSS